MTTSPAPSTALHRSTVATVSNARCAIVVTGRTSAYRPTTANGTTAIVMKPKLNKMNNTEKQETAAIAVFVPDSSTIQKLDQMKPVFSTVTKYKTADDWATIKDKPLRAYFLGLTDITNDAGEAVQCGHFVTSDEIFISGQRILVDAVRTLPVKTPVEITYRGKKANKSSDGSTMMFDVKILQ